MKAMRYFSLVIWGVLFLSCSEVLNGSKSADQNNEYTGMFTYMADANMFFPCDGSARMPIAMTGEYLTLEKKYTALAKGSGERIFTRLEGYTKEVPAMEGNGKELALVVTKVMEIDDAKECE